MPPLVRQNEGMLKKLWSALQAPVVVAIPDPLWDRTIADLAFLHRLAPGERVRLRELAGRLLADKQMAGAAGLELTAAMQVSIAAQASVPILNLGLNWYRGWSGIVVYPDEFLVPRRVTDADGVVHETTETLSGEAWQDGPLVLSWRDADATVRRRRDDGGDEAAYNVVIHEFTHKLDLLDGSANGVPPFDPRLHPDLDRIEWQRALDDALERMDSELELIASELPEGMDPDAPEADRYYAHLPLDPYATADEGEFFAVSSEAFFIAPRRLRDAFPQWYAQLVRFFRQDPLQAERL
jgi:hypothetical protein